MISLQLANGKFIKIAGDVFMEFDESGNIEVLVSSENSSSAPSSEVKSKSFKVPPTPLSLSKKENSPPNKPNLEDIEKGKEKWGELISIWKVNWAVEDSEQPDRGQLLQDVMNYHSKSVYSFLSDCGGITEATIQTSNPIDGKNDNPNFRLECRVLAENIAQVASILTPPLDQFLEYPFHV